MTPMRMIGLVAVRELRERALRKTYLLGTAAMLAVVVAVVVLPSMLIDDGPTETTLGIVGEAPADLEDLVAASLPEEREVTTTDLDDRDAAEAALEDEDVDAVLVERRELLFDGPANLALQAALDGALRQEAMAAGLADAGLDDQQAAAALRPPAPLEAVDISGEGVGDEAFLVAILATVLLIIGVQMSGAQLLNGALEEKSNRVVEILVSTARPWQLLSGKVLATSGLAFAQLVLMVGVALIANDIVDAFPLPEATGTVLWVAAVMLVAGFLFYAALFTVAGTMASTVEDAQSAAGPLYIAMWGTYGVVSLTVLPNPAGLVAQILTYLPPTAPFVVPARVALGELPMWQLPIAVAVTLAGAAAVLKLAGRLYAASVLAGGKLTWNDALKVEPVR
jgi:ABC-2 type transport system permease protein